MVVESLPQYSVQELNAAVGNLLARGFAPKFLLQATVSKCQLKKGHLWLTLTDSKASITAVVWASTLNKINFTPNEDDGVLIVGRLNFWEARATLNIQVLDIRPSISTVLRQFELVKLTLLKEGLLDESRRRKLPTYPNRIAILTSVPSSALADMLSTAKDRWPLSKLLIIPIPVQGRVESQIQLVLRRLAKCHKKLFIDVIVLARGGGSREDLMVFDNEELCRELAGFPLPVVTGLGHEDDWTVADLVADYRAATPTAAIVSLLPSRKALRGLLAQKRQRLNDCCAWIIRRDRQILLSHRKALEAQTPVKLIRNQKSRLRHRYQLLNALSPDRWFSKGFAILKNTSGMTITSIKQVSLQENLTIELKDGQIDFVSEKISPSKDLK